jgi:hypothetical protein
MRHFVYRQEYSTNVARNLDLDAIVAKHVGKAKLLPKFFEAYPDGHMPSL